MTRDALVGTTLAGYTLVDRVGEGGTATVYRASHAEHGTVAFKVLREKLRQDRTAVARFTREAGFGTRVQHPNVIRTIQTGEENGVPFLVIEWAAGELLESYAKRHAPFPPDEVCAIVSQIASAVFAAHQAGIVHRDLKPDNVMYDHESRTVKLLDFGIATATDTTPDQRLTRAGFFVGTLMYVAPEALSGEIVSPAADQYSLATMAYLFLTGALPYTARSPRDMFTQLLSQPPVPLNKAKPELQFTSEVEAVVMKGLAKLPSDRYADVVAFADALCTVLKDPFPAAAPSGGLFSKMKGLFGR
ncbi:serine/threonine-protein kinase [Pseudogemmatithrix spongiicola]|uniref:Serine/threonine-protein kinase n=1 Tax=Pseudogemmatithrix spongiicola TaxID=3062599 RepID=A0AA49JX55_9BACT|nr:serine/threonine-protein kinase [Gemmatimonadaceae bacterium 'strain 138']WKW13687.1 serine/threonine-protein kinase [Gemmatimonadaceae bacterium 'strain 318']